MKLTKSYNKYVAEFCAILWCSYQFFTKQKKTNLDDFFIVTENGTVNLIERKI